MKRDLFFEQVWDLTTEIPKAGSRLTAQLQKAIGACGLAQLPAPYYCVISSNGLLSGDPSSTTKRQQLPER